MRLNDLLILPIAALWQQKLRTMLTTLGVVFGAFVLAASLSIGQGVQETINNESRKHEFSRTVTVQPKWDNISTKTDGDDQIEVEGTMKADRRDRLRKALATLKKRETPAQTRVDLSRDRLDKIAGIPHVNQVIPTIFLNGFALFGDRSEPVSVVAVRPNSKSAASRIIAGRYFDAPDQKGVVITELLAYRLGLRNDADIEAQIGKPLRLEFRTMPAGRGFGIYLMRSSGIPSRDQQTALDKVTANLPGSLEKLGLSPIEAGLLRKAIEQKPGGGGEAHVQVEEYPILGVIRPSTEAEMKDSQNDFRFVGDADIYVSYKECTSLFFRGSDKEDYAVNMATVIVDDEAHVKNVMKQVEGLNLTTYAAIEFIERERLIYLLIFGGMTCVAAVALLVSALGIANTMLMSVLERTREIGIMKAVGADNRHLQWIFLVEGGLIGMLGGLVGLLLAWSASFPGDAWVRSMIMRDIKIDLKSSIFVFPPWIALTVVGFTLVVTTLAAVYPARHAARIDPVSALRHE